MMTRTHLAQPTLWLDFNSADAGALRSGMRKAADAGVAGLYAQVCDQTWNGTLTVGPRILAMLASGPLPICASVRTAKPDGLIAQLAEAGCKMIALEAEAPIHLHRALTVIRAAGVRSAVSLSPATPLTRLEYLVAEADAVILDACEPGQTGGVHTQVLSERTRILKEFLRSETDAKEIIVTGAAAPFDAAHALAAGASTIVVGAAGLSKEGFDAFQSELTTRTRALESPA